MASSLYNFQAIYFDIDVENEDFQNFPEIFVGNQSQEKEKVYFLHSFNNHELSGHWELLIPKKI